MDLSLTEILIGLVPGLGLGLILSKIFFKAKSAKGIASSADNKLKLENEVLLDKVKQLEAKIQTLEKALEKIVK